MLPFSIMAQAQNRSSGGQQIQDQLWLSDSARIAQYPVCRGTFLTPALPLFCMIFLSSKNNSSKIKNNNSYECYTSLAENR